MPEWQLALVDDWEWLENESLPLDAFLGYLLGLLGHGPFAANLVLSAIIGDFVEQNVATVFRFHDEYRNHLALVGTWQATAKPIIIKNILLSSVTIVLYFGANG